MPGPGLRRVRAVGVEQRQHLDPAEVDSGGTPGKVGEVVGGDEAVPVAEPAGDRRLAVAADSASLAPQVASGLLTLKPPGRVALLLMAPMATWPCEPPP